MSSPLFEMLRIFSNTLQYEWIEMNNFDFEKYFPYPLSAVVGRAFAVGGDGVRQIRLSRNGFLSLDVGGKNVFPHEARKASNDLIRISDGMFDECFFRACEYSVHTYASCIREGFIPLDGGHRVGVCGSAVSDGGQVLCVKNISSLDYRVAHAFFGCSEPGLRYITDGRRIKNTVIASRPGGGKTTFIRDLARSLSAKSFRVCVVDTRSEIAAMKNGVAGFDLGALTSVFDGYPKPCGIEAAVRAFSPDAVICDEIGSETELSALRFLMARGVPFVITVHCLCGFDLTKNSVLSSLLGEKLVETVVFLDSDPFPTHIKEVFSV